MTLENLEDQLVFKLGLCSGSLKGLLPSALVVKDSGGAMGVPSVSEIS
jgi:hypothetical protein